MAIKSVQRRVGCEKQQVPAPEIVCNYNKYTGGIDGSDRLRATFSLGKQHKFKKYYVKLMLFLVDIALINAWIYYQMANDQVGGKAGDRADFYICIASEMIRQDLDFEALYKVRAQGNRTLRPRQNTRNDESGTNDDDDGYDSKDDYIEDLIMRPNIQMTDDEHAALERFLKQSSSDTCIPCSFTSFPFPLKKRSKSCQVCQYKLKKPTWKDVVMSAAHGVRLCLKVHPPRSMVQPALIKCDGSDVTDFSWTSPETASCWDKLHSFYAGHGLFSNKNNDLTQKKTNLVQCSTHQTCTRRSMQH